jgi:hypothetical protein
MRWVNYDNISLGVDFIFGEHNVDSLTKGIESGRGKHM